MASYTLWALSYNFGLFVVARILAGVSKGNVSLSTAIVTDVTSVEKRSRGMVSGATHTHTPPNSHGLARSKQLYIIIVRLGVAKG